MKLSNFMKLFKPYLFEELYRKAGYFRKKGVDVINLAIGDPDIPTDSGIVKKAVEEIKNPANHRYPNTKGNEVFRKAVSYWHKRRHGINLDYDKEISILIGSKEGIAHLPLVLMNEGDYCLIPDPTYPTYRTGVWMVGGKIHYVPLMEKNNFLPDLSKIPEKIIKKTKLFFLNYPNNPTGAYMDKYYMKELVKWARKRNVFLALDCAYAEMYFNEPTNSIFEIDGAKDIAVEFYSVSKTYSMAGWRAGWVCGNSDAVCALNTVKENIDSGQFNAIQNACAYALDNHEKIVPKIRETFKKRADTFSLALSKSGWRFKRPDGTCFIWAKPPVDMDSIKACDYILNKTGVLLAPGSGFGKYGEGYVRISTTEKEEIIKKAAVKISSIDWRKI
ncbi:MAG: aminotransferase class I/II-fold pyridoxal phosphate-dependent enzyme [Elusimicrobiota bacterium]